MFIKRKTRAGKAYAYQMLVSVKVSLTCKKILTSRWITVSTVKQLSLDTSQFFAGHSPILTKSCANI